MRLIHSTSAVEAGGDDVLSSSSLDEIHVDRETEVPLSSLCDSVVESERVCEVLDSLFPCACSLRERLNLDSRKGKRD